MTENQNEPIDLFSIREEIEAQIREEYRKAREDFENEKVKLTRQKYFWEDAVNKLKATLIASGKYAEDHDDLVDADGVIKVLSDELGEYFKFMKMMELINGNPLLKSQWDKVVMSIRLVGGDENGK